MIEPQGACLTIERGRDDEVVRRFLVFGTVQGVYFRHSTRLEAKRLGVRGFARNLPDGSVEVLAYGAAAAVDELRDWLGHGPSQAKVAEVRELDSEPAPAPPGPGGFNIF
jgi:acylphosphatase